MPKELKVALIGWGMNAEKCLDAMMADGVEPEVVFLPKKYDYQPLQDKCITSDIKTVLFDRVASLEGPMAGAGSDLLISASCPYRIPSNLLSFFCLGGINVHASYLPFYRGVHPVNWALINGEKEIGVTVHWMDENIDTGDIIKQEMIPVTITDDINTMIAKLTDLGAALLAGVIRQFKAQCVVSDKQEVVSPCPAAPRRTPEQGKINWHQNSREIFNLCRALYSPYPNAFGYLNGHKVKVNKVIVDTTPGRILAIVQPNRVVISTGDGVMLCDIETDENIEVGDILG